eukprot:CAMPEP_0183704728 /NCGR_PEP_ID=MMETSP0737-20130205/2013_1 /TAXON_ID=385413 /ORGANISM="Thalassiosira miniscula, Strain CCMP1093" /LENGTH=514 /DNA_ID=CAMNT_0025931709 /DNA_START=146 /DNA_END=1690 /DNA_ORIENTATION=+
MADPATVLAATTPNSKPRQQQTKNVQTYVYQDFANAEPSTLNTGTCHERVPPQSLQSQKLPSKLSAMLSDPDLASVITWMPHGRSWKILNRELFASFALPRYFGHSNHASFVRIVNAWGFRRVTKGTDRDSYYHELFLRGKPRLHERMKRLPTCHRKTPVDKDEKCPDFYELAKISPLPELSWSAGSGGGSVVARASAMNQVTAEAAAAGYLGNPMAANVLSHSFVLGAGIGNHNSNALFGNLPSTNSGVESYLNNTNNQSNEISLLKLIRQQQDPLQQHQQVQQGSNNASNVMNQNLMHQLLRMQHANPQQQLRNLSTSPDSLCSVEDPKSTLGKLASVAGTFAQPPTTTSSSDSILNSLTSTSMNGTIPNQPQRRLSNDKISVNDVLQLRSIERTNELLAQKLASLQQDTQKMMKQTDIPNSAADQANSANKPSPLPGAGVPMNMSTGNATSEEEMLLQMIRRENQMNTVSLNHQAGGAPAKVSAQVMEDGGGGMSQGLNHLLKSLTGLQQR